MAQKIGIWGCLVLGIIMVVSTYMRHGTDDLMRYAGGVSLLMFAFAFWLFRKNAEAMADVRKRQEDRGRD